MRNTAAKIQCINPNCQVFNLESENCCTKCQTPIVKRYLWGVGEAAASFKIGELVGDRYLVKQVRQFLDTKPGKDPEIPEEIPTEIIPYLLLFPYRLHVPQVYGLLPNAEGEIVWLLEYNYLPLSQNSLLAKEELLCPITEIWSETQPLRQLNWLWQIAQLWQPLQRHKAAATLLNPSLIRTRGAIIQLQELDFNREQEPTLSQLGTLWQEWIEQSSPQIRDFLTQLCQNLKNNQIANPKHLVSILDQGIYEFGKQQQRKYQIFTLTDSGPSRDHNEDNCYPKSGQSVQDVPIAVVCDGLGGQEGGEIASKLTIDALTEKLNQLQFEQKKWHPESNLNELEKMIRQVNDQISARNDLEKRKERQRMGTTIVMAVARAHEIYLTHVGDSRMYLITKNGAYQLTVDDDLAARETRLGYALYRQALQFPNCGALTQALGMASSHGLHINRKCLILDEECILLLCSDGLSDFDRVEQYWENKILPILTQGISLATVGNQLVKIANEKNGHDNVTVAILHCQVIQKKTPQNLLWAQIKSNFPTVPPEDSSGDLSNSEMPTVPMGSVPVKAYATNPPQDSTSVENSPEQNNSTQSTPSKVNPFILGILGAAILAGLSYFLWSLFFSQSNPDNSQPNQPQTYQTE